MNLFFPTLFISFRPFSISLKFWIEVIDITISKKLSGYGIFSAGANLYSILFFCFALSNRSFEGSIPYLLHCQGSVVRPIPQPTSNNLSSLFGFRCFLINSIF